MIGAGFGALIGGARNFAFGGDPVSGAVAGAGFGAGVAARRDIMTMHGEEGVVARGVLRGMGGGGGYGGYTPYHRPVLYGGGAPIVIDRGPPNWGGAEYRGYGHGGGYGGYGAARYGAPQMVEPPGILERLFRTFLGGERAVPPAGSPMYVQRGAPTSYREIGGYAPSPAMVAQGEQQSPRLPVQGAEDVAQALPVAPPAKVEARPLPPVGGEREPPAIKTEVDAKGAFQAAAPASAGALHLQDLAAGKEKGGFDKETYAKALKSLPAGPAPS